MLKKTYILKNIIFFSLCILAVNSYGQDKMSPLDFLKEQEFKNREKEGEIYLGKVMTLLYPAYTIKAQRDYFPLFLELTDILKSPLRKNYRMVLKGYTDDLGDERENLEISVKRAENLKQLLIDKYYMDGERISTEGHGETDPIASNDSTEGRRLNRRVEIHIYGDVSEAVKFIEKQEETK